MTPHLTAPTLRSPLASIMPRHLPLIYLTLLVMVTFTLRIVWLDTLPRSLSFDESVDGLDALQLVRNRWLTPFLQNNFGRETLFLYLQGVLLHLVGISAFALRLASALVGTLAVPMMYAVGRRLAVAGGALPRPVAHTLTGLIAATGMAVCYWHLFFSRQALRAILLLPLLLAVVWCLWRAHHVMKRGDRRGPIWLLLAGLLLGLCQYTYLAARLLPALFILPTVVWLVRTELARTQRAIRLACFWGMLLVTALPLALYFVHSPQAFDSRVEAIAIPIAEAPGEALAANLGRLLFMHFGFGGWLAEWPSLQPLLGVGVLIGLVVCVRHIRCSPAGFSLAWLSLGWIPALLSRQDWDAITTILRGIVAWPAVYLVAAIGWTALTDLGYRWVVARGTIAGRRTMAGVILAPAIVLLAGGAITVHDYFSIWAASYDPAGSHARPLAVYLNGQTDRLTLCPNRFCTDAATAFLLQARYPSLASAAPEAVQAHLAAKSVAYLLPRDGEMPSAWLLLDPAGAGPGVAYVLPQLSGSQTLQLAEHAARQERASIIVGDRGETIADILVPDVGAVKLWSHSLRIQPVNALFDATIRLNGFSVQPPMVKRGQQIVLRLAWEAERPIDGDHDVFIHLFHVPTGRRIGQINESLGSAILLPAHRWAAGLSVVDLHTFTLPPDAPEGAYRFEVGLYHRSSLARLPVTSVAPTVADSVVLGKCLLQDSPPPLPMFALSAPFEDNIHLAGLDLPPAAPGQVSLVLHWQAMGPVIGNYTVFVHLVDRAQGNLVTQKDNMPQRGTYPTSLWSAGEEILDPYDLQLPTDLADSRYALRIGLYDAATGQRLNLQNAMGNYVEVPLQMVGGHLHIHEVAP